MPREFSIRVNAVYYSMFGKHSTDEADTHTFKEWIADSQKSLNNIYIYCSSGATIL